MYIDKGNGPNITGLSRRGFFKWEWENHVIQPQKQETFRGGQRPQWGCTQTDQEGSEVQLTQELWHKHHKSWIMKQTPVELESVGELRIPIICKQNAKCKAENSMTFKDRIYLHWKPQSKADQSTLKKKNNSCYKYLGWQHANKTEGISCFTT